MSRVSKSQIEKFFGNTATSYDWVVNFATFGRDSCWKERIVEETNGNTILDLACGTGILTRMIAKKLPNSEIIGVDISSSYLEVARENSKQFGNVSFTNQDAEKLNVGKKFDCIISSYIPKYCDATTLIKKCLVHLNPRGIIILHDFTCPKNIVVRWIWRTHFVLLRLCGMLITHWKYAFKELPELICSSNWVNEYTLVMKEYKMKTEVKRYTFGCSTIIYAKQELQKEL